MKDFPEVTEFSSGLPLILNCSPRNKGNSQWAAEKSLEMLREKGLDALYLNLSDYKVTPCIGCDLCKGKMEKTDEKIRQKSKYYLGCPLSLSDTSSEILEKMITAPALYFFSPIYHYHLPASFKALLDRLQPFYWVGSTEDYRFTSGAKPCFSVLVAGRPRGELLFSGSLLTIKYSLATLGFKQEEALPLRGIDKKDDFSKNDMAQEKLEKYISASLPLIEA